MSPLFERIIGVQLMSVMGRVDMDRAAGNDLDSSTSWRVRARLVPHEREAHMSDWMQHDYLVYEATGDPVPAYTCFFTEHTCVGHVRAEDPVAAAKVITGVTGRVGRYAVVEVTVVDLAAPDPHGYDLVAHVADTPHRAQ
jgi:hypothetical protein